DLVCGSQPSRHHPVSRDNLCVKGWHIHESVNHPERLTTPLIRKNNVLTPATWEEALDFTAQQLSRARDQHSGTAIGVLTSAKCTNEENYLLQKFARTALNTNNVDHCARL
ncbi:MAG: molybdopterin-dependent oxidoreductase, partial [Desulfurivibrio sp.]|nr:molybdopterin-dependent oxidoreductase [Desulfurivibrio sp.]MBU4119893.1 molybdopterin-dependent oxidoreductase [Pseudomonadota bacterium]